MNTEPLTDTKLKNAYFNLLTPIQQEIMADFGRYMYNDFEKYQNPVSQTHTTSLRLSDEEEIEWLIQQIMSGLQSSDINKRGKKLLKKAYGRNWEKLLF
jgi:hypothetical protein